MRFNCTAERHGTLGIAALLERLANELWIGPTQGQRRPNAKFA